MLLLKMNDRKKISVFLYLLLMRLEKYQNMALAYVQTKDQTEQIALAVCEIFNLSHDRVDNMSKLEFMLYCKRIEKITRKLITRPWYFKKILLTEAEKITLGQFIEIQHWVKQGEVESLPLIAASILLNRGEHKQDVKRMLKTNVRKLLQDVKAFMSSFEELLKSYSGLFEKDEIRGDETDEEIEQMEKEKALEVHPFVEQYGWIYAATKVAAYEGISLEQAYGLPVIQAFNDLAYLKSEQDYQKQMQK